MKKAITLLLSVEAIHKMVESGELSAEDIHAAAERIRALKKAHSIK